MGAVLRAKVMETFLLQPRDDKGPVFNEPWEANAFAMVIALHDSGLFTWDEWAAALGDEIKLAQYKGDPDLGDTYYRHLQNALEKILVEKNISSSKEIIEKVEQWRHAYHSAPHGQLIELK